MKSIFPVSSAVGAIEKILIVVNMDPDLMQEGISKYAGVFKQFPNVEFIVFGNFVVSDPYCSVHEIEQKCESIKQEILDGFQNYDPEVHNFIIHISPILERCNYIQSIQPSYKCHKKCDHFSKPPEEWAQDIFSVLNTDEGIPVLVDSYYKLNLPDQFAAEQLSNELGYLIKSTKYYIAGGDILTGDDYIIVGFNMFSRNKRLHGRQIDEFAFRDRFCKDLKALYHVSEVYCPWPELPKGVVELLSNGGSFSGFIHIDLFMTLARTTDTGEELMLLGRVDPKHYDKDFHASDLEAMANLNKAIDKVGEWFSTIKNRNGQSLFRVDHIPLLIYWSEQNMYKSFNNSIVEITDNDRNIYVPNYDPDGPNDIIKYDDVNNELDRQLKPYKIKRIPVIGDFNYWASRAGSLHCVTKVLKRKTTKQSD